MQNKGAVSQDKGLRNESKTKCWFLEGMGMLNTAATWVLEWAEDQRKRILVQGGMCAKYCLSHTHYTLNTWIEMTHYPTHMHNDRVPIKTC